MTRAVYLVGDRPLSEHAMACLLMADLHHGQPIVIVDGEYFEVPEASAPAPLARTPMAEPITDPAYVGRAQAAAEAKRARKAARRAAAAAREINP